MRSKTLLALVALLALFSGPLYALGLGDASVRSFLNEPLDVRLALIGATDGQLDEIEAALASADDFEMVGLSRAVLTVPLEFEVVTDAGAPYVAVTSRLPVDQPVLQLLVEVSWSGGRMLRQYTLFLDPPTVASPPPTRPAPRPAAETARPAEAPAPSRPAGAGDEPASAGAVAPPRPAPSGSLEHGPVGDGETLWSIARDWSRGSGYTVNQMMLAIQRENPDAFIRDNINLLKRGAILRLPTRDRAGDLSAAEARLEVARQNDGAGLAPLPTLEDTPPTVAQEAGVDTAAPAEPEAATAGESGSAADAAADEAASVSDAVAAVEEAVEEAPAGEPMGGRLELVPPSEEELAQAGDGSGAADEPASDVDLARVEEELESQQQANEYLSERVRELEQQLEQTRGELSVADRELAQMEASLRAQRAAQAGKGALPWWLWVIGGVVIVAVGGGLLAWRRGREEEGEVVSVAHEEAPTRVQDLREEAEELLGVLGEEEARAGLEDGDAPPPEDRPADESAGDDATVVMRAVPDPEPPSAAGDESTVVVPHPALIGRAVGDASDEAEAEDDAGDDAGDDGVGDEAGDDAYLDDAIDVDEPWARGDGGASDAEDEADDETRETPPRQGADGDLDDLAEVEEDLAGVDEWPQDDAEDEAGDDGSSSGDAVELDAADPEIKLDLARAYLSLGDREAARAMLEEVLAVGNEEQKAEAAAMMDEL